MCDLIMGKAETSQPGRGVDPQAVRDPGEREKCGEKRAGETAQWARMPLGTHGHLGLDLRTHEESQTRKNMKLGG